MKRSRPPRAVAIATAAVLLMIVPLASAAGQPPPPPSVSCSPQADGVHVTWDAVSGATSYNVWRKVGNNGAWIQIGSTTTTSFVDHTAASGQLYHYAVSTVNADGESDRGGTCNVTSIPFFPNALVSAAAVAGSLGVVGLSVLSRRRR